MNGLTFKINGEISEEGKRKLLEHIEKGRKKMEDEKRKYQKYFSLLDKMNKEKRFEEFIYTENDKYFRVYWNGSWSWPSEITFLE